MQLALGGDGRDHRRQNARQGEEWRHTIGFYELHNVIALASMCNVEQLK